MTASHAEDLYGDGESELASYSRFCASVYAREANNKDYDGEDDEDDAQCVSCETNVCMSPMTVSEHANGGAEQYLPSYCVSMQRGIEDVVTHATTTLARTSAGAAAPAKAAAGTTVSSRQRNGDADDSCPDVDGSGGGGGTKHNHTSPCHQRTGWRLVYDFPMINPNSAARTNWDVIIGFCILYSGVFVPLSIAFTPTRKGIGVFGLIELITDSILLCDVCANFRTGFTDAKGTLVMDPKQVQYNIHAHTHTHTHTTSTSNGEPAISAHDWMSVRKHHDATLILILRADVDFPYNLCRFCSAPLPCEH